MSQYFHEWMKDASNKMKVINNSPEPRHDFGMQRLEQSSIITTAARCAATYSTQNLRNNSPTTSIDAEAASRTTGTERCYHPTTYIILLPSGGRIMRCPLCAKQWPLFDQGIQDGAAPVRLDTDRKLKVIV
jgi:hypothetical protein